MCPKDADEMANSVDPDQTALSGNIVKILLNAWAFLFIIIHLEKTCWWSLEAISLELGISSITFPSDVWQYATFWEITSLYAFDDSLFGKSS